MLRGIIVEVKAPGVVKLLGEHAVVYGKLAAAAALDFYAVADIRENQSNKLVICLPDLNKQFEFSDMELDHIYSIYKERKNIQEFIELSKMEKDELQYAAIASVLQKEHSIKCTGKTVEIKSDIPIQKGFASSAACSVSFTCALLKMSGKNLDDSQFIEVARIGEKVAHKNEGAGRIDISTSYFGGVTSFSASQGARKENLHDSAIPMLLVDTGPKKSTAETVGIVSSLYNSRREYVDEILNTIHECTQKGIDALKNGDMALLGSLMYKDHEMLNLLNVSSDGLDRAVDIAKENGAYGAKLSGGGGGGIAIALTEENSFQKLSEKFTAQGFKVSSRNISDHGAKSFL